MAEENVALVFDIGSGMAKVGFSGPYSSYFPDSIEQPRMHPEEFFHLVLLAL
jgi:actin-related protein